MAPIGGTFSAEPRRRAPAEHPPKGRTSPEHLADRAPTGSKETECPKSCFAPITGATKESACISQKIAQPRLTLPYRLTKYENGEASAKTIGAKAHAIQLDVTDHIFGCAIGSAERPLREFVRLVCWSQRRQRRRLLSRPHIRERLKFNPPMPSRL